MLHQKQRGSPAMVCIFGTPDKHTSMCLCLHQKQRGSPVMICILGTPDEHTSMCMCLIITGPITESGNKIIKDWNVPVMSKTSTDCHQRKNVDRSDQKDQIKTQQLMPFFFLPL